MNEYLEMCEAAYELNDNWSPAPGDRVFLTKDLYVYDKHLTGIRYLGQRPVYKKGFYHLSEFSIDEVLDPEIFFSFCVFIPYQHQIQKKILKNLGSVYKVLWSFHDFVFTKKFGKLVMHYNIEELWLLFYYYIIHNKMWNGEDWVLIEEVEEDAGKLRGY